MSAPGVTNGGVYKGAGRPFHFGRSSPRRPSVGPGTAYKRTSGCCVSHLPRRCLPARPRLTPQSVEERAAICSACHGLKGVPEDKSSPIIWGQNVGYLYLQFRDFQKEARKAEPMVTVAKLLVKEDALALSEYFSAKPWPDIGAPAASKADADMAKGAIKSVVCTSCHLEQFQGDSSVPRLAGRGATISTRR